MTPTAISTATGVLWRQGIQLKEVGTKLFYVTVSYAERKNDVGSYNASFTTTGGTFNIKVGYAQTAYKASGDSNPPNNNGAIGKRDNGEIEGADIVVPALRLQIDFKHPQGYMTIDQIKQVARNTGKTNSAPFLGFAAGEVLFLGANGRAGSESETTVGYEFACSENLQNEVIGGITVTEKKGWDVLSVTFQDVVSNDQGARQPRYIYVTRVYRQFDMGAFFGFGA
jgi:hypothetical protein